MKKSFCLLLMLVFFLQPYFASALQAQNDQGDIIMTSLKKELDRSFLKLEKAGTAPLYFLAYRLHDVQTFNVVAEYGALAFEPNLQHKRVLNVEMRVGMPEMDNTHPLRQMGQLYCLRSSLPALIPIENDEKAIRSAIWLKTDSAFQNAQQRYANIKAYYENQKQMEQHLSSLQTQPEKQTVKSPEPNKKSVLPEEKMPDDFSAAKTCVYQGNPVTLAADCDQWNARVRRLSAIYCHYPHILHSRVEFAATKTCRYLINSEGTAVQDAKVNYRVYTMAQAKTSDSANVWLYDGAEAMSPEALPSEEILSGMISHLAERLEKLRLAPLAESYSGPVIFKGRAAAIYVHDTIGNQMENCPGRPNYLTQLVGQQSKILPNFISVVDDPTIEKTNSQPVIGSYAFDEDGVPAQKVTIIDHGIFQTLLVGRSLVKGITISNGHARCAPGYNPAARQSNLIIMSANSVPYKELRARLIAEAKKQGKPYGMVIDEITGGLTTGNNVNAKPQPLIVTRVYVDGRPDELIRGLSFGNGGDPPPPSNILATDDDATTFNGFSAGTSGPIPASVTSPSLLVQTFDLLNPSSNGPIKNQTK